MWHVKVLAEEGEEEIVTEHEDVPDGELIMLLFDIREKMRTWHKDENLCEFYHPDQQIVLKLKG